MKIESKIARKYFMYEYLKKNRKFSNSESKKNSQDYRHFSFLIFSKQKWKLKVKLPGNILCYVRIFKKKSQIF